MVTKYAPLTPVSLGSIKPQGWLKQFIATQKKGLTGQINTAGYPFDSDGWGSDLVISMTDQSAENQWVIPWWPYEQYGYWIDGMIRAGILLDDSELIERAAHHIHWVLSHADSDGYLGPKHLKEPVLQNRWVHAVFFRAIVAYFEYSKDATILEALQRHYLSKTSEHSWNRETVNIEIMCWLYEKTADSAILQLALKAYQQCMKLPLNTLETRKENPDIHMHPNTELHESQMHSGQNLCMHGVTFNEQAKLPAILYSYLGERKLLETSLNTYAMVLKNHMLHSGVHSSNEFLNGNDPHNSHETCDIADFMWSASYLYMATGDAAWADRIERAAFNAALGAITKDFTALQYFSCPNQVIATNNSDHNPETRGSSQMAYRPNHFPPCCPGEVNRIYPNFIGRMWHTADPATLVVSHYGASRVENPFGEQLPCTITQKTAYPFDDTIHFSFAASSPVPCTLRLRIPGWCSGARVLLNDECVSEDLHGPRHVDIQHNFTSSDTLSLVLPMPIRVVEIPGSSAKGVERGPLVCALDIKEVFEVDTQEPSKNPALPNYNITAASDWNYAINTSAEAQKRYRFCATELTEDNPWQKAAVPFSIEVPAKKVKNWDYDRQRDVSFGLHFGSGKRQGEFCFTPPLPDQATLEQHLDSRETMVRLIPYGATCLRISLFPWYEA